MVVVVAVVAIVLVTAIGVPARAWAGPIVASRSAVVTGAGAVAISHIDIGLRYDRRAGGVSVIAVVGAVTVAVHRCAVRINRAATEQGGDHDGGERCKTFHFLDRCEWITSVRPLLSLSVARGLYAFVRNGVLLVGSSRKYVS
jgi:hypothetical protein